MLRWKEWTSAQCPRCGLLEDAAHVWICKGRGANVVWDKAILRLKEWLISVRTDPAITNAITLGLQTWRQQGRYENHFDGKVYCAVAQQGDIGWGNLVEGWIAIEWETIQQDYYQAIHSRRTGSTWSSQLLLRLWSIAGDMWENRNETLHQQENIISQTHEEALHRRIQRLHEELTQQPLSTKDSYLGNISLPDLIKKSWTYKSEWCRSATVVLNRNKNVSLGRSRNLRYMRNIMSKWLSNKSGKV